MAAKAAGGVRFKARPTIVFVGVFVFMLSASIVLVPLPKFVVRSVVNVFGEWLVREPTDSSSSPLTLLRTLVGEAVQQSLIAHFHADGAPRGGLDDIEFAGRQLRRLRMLVVNQSEVNHSPSTGAIAITGLAWCDMANGLGGRLLAHDFDSVQLVGVRDELSGGGHSFGRFWSRQYDDWIYFDLWSEEVLVFRVDSVGNVVYAWEDRPLGARVNWPADIAVSRMAHAQVSASYVHQHLQSTVGGYFRHRLRNVVARGTTRPIEIRLGNRVALLPGLQGTPVWRIPDSDSPMVRYYIRARVEQFLGSYDAAASLYRQALQIDDVNSVYGDAARVFHARLTKVAPGGDGVVPSR